MSLTLVSTRGVSAAPRARAARTACARRPLRPASRSRAPAAAMASGLDQVAAAVTASLPVRLRARGGRRRPREWVRGERHVRPGGCASFRAHRERRRDRGRRPCGRDVRAQGWRGRRVGDAGKRQRLLREEVVAKMERALRACRTYVSYWYVTHPRREEHARVCRTTERETDERTSSSRRRVRRERNV